MPIYHMMNTMTKGKTNPFPELSDMAKNFLSLAKARDETVSEGIGRDKHGNKKDPCGKDTKSFWFLLGFFQGYAEAKQ